MPRPSTGRVGRCLVDTLEPRQLLAASVPYHLELARRLVTELSPQTAANPNLALANNVYTNGASTLTIAGVNGATVTKNASDCTTLITRLLTLSYGFTSTQMNSWFGSTSPNLNTYYAKAEANVGWEAFTTLSDLRIGDLFIADYTDDEPARGHMGIIDAPPTRRGLLSDGSGLTRWDVTIIDSTGAPHSSNDTRSGVVDPTEADTGDGYASGVGRGYMSFFTDEANAPGVIQTWSWSAINNAFRYSPVTEPIRLAKIQPTVNNASFNFDDAGQTVSIDFQRRMAGTSFSAADLVVKNLTTGNSYIPASVTVNADASVAKWKLPAGLPDGDYQFTLNKGSVTTQNGNALAVTHTLTNTGTFLLSGDVNRDRAVNFSDLLILAKHYGNIGSDYAQGNIDFDAQRTVGFSDLLILAKNYGKTLAAPTAGASPAGGLASVDAPATESTTTKTRTRVATSILA